MSIYTPLTVAVEKGTLLMISPPGNDTLNRALPILANYVRDKIDGLNRFHPIISQSYRDTGQKFASGQANAFYGGSFLSYILCARNLAIPIARGEDIYGINSYHSVLISQRGTPYTGAASVKGKRITYVKEASAGEMYARKLLGGEDPSSVDQTRYIPSKSHELAIQYLRVGRADFAFVKNLVWEKNRWRYPDLVVVDEDNGENPNNVFLVSPAIYALYGEALKQILLNLHTDPDPRAQQLLSYLNLKKFIPTTYPESFSHTAQLVKDAGVDAQSHRFTK